MTHPLRVGRTDTQRNCISNIHTDRGLNYVQAAHRLVDLMTEAQHRQLTGGALKDAIDEVPPLVQPSDSS